MRFSWASRFLLPVAQAVAEGGWLAVVYAALQAITASPAWMGPLELGALAGMGMAWGRRRRWRSPAAEAIGLPLLALVAGALGWILSPDVRLLLVNGDLLGALGAHAPGWLGAIAFWRGEVHRSREDDDAIQDQLLRWAVPGLAIPWLAGHLVAEGPAEAEFRAAAFVGTVFFVTAAFTAMGLARLEAVRATTGSDWRANRSWLALVVGLALGITLFAIPAAAFLGVPARTLMAAMLGPLHTIAFAILLLATPIIVAAAAAAELLGPLIPAGWNLGSIKLPSFAADQRTLTSNAPTVVFYAIVGVLVLLELLALAGILWVRWQEKRRQREVLTDPFEERAIVVPGPDERVAPARIPPRPVRRRSPADPVDAYLSALDLLARDGRWTRWASESPASHAARIGSGGESVPGLGRLASAYQLVRYGNRPLSSAERARTPGRLSALRAFLRRTA